MSTAQSLPAGGRRPAPATDFHPAATLCSSTTAAVLSTAIVSSFISVSPAGDLGFPGQPGVDSASVEHSMRLTQLPLYSLRARSWLEDSNSLPPS